jgi:hypothetical protein
MTEAEWLACDDPAGLAHGLHGWASRRKFLLFAAACLGRLPDPHPGDLAPRATAVLEAYADGAATPRDVAELRAATPPGEPPPALFTQGLGSDAGFWGGEAGRDHAAWQTAWHLAGLAVARGPGRPSARAAAAWRERRAVAVGLVRCVFGNPFRPDRPGPWITPAAVTVARDAYDRRDFSALPVLADLLEEAGCPEQSVLDHCQKPGEHARGCWVVDLVLGKT